MLVWGCTSVAKSRGKFPPKQIEESTKLNPPVQGAMRVCYWFYGYAFLVMLRVLIFAAWSASLRVFEKT